MNLFTIWLRAVRDTLTDYLEPVRDTTPINVLADDDDECQVCQPLGEYPDLPIQPRGFPPVTRGSHPGAEPAHGAGVPPQDPK